jgi:signal transduction histidine kinase/streptogramin lyase
MKTWLEKVRKTKRRNIWRFLSLCCICLFGCSIGFALDRDRSIAEFQHTAWTAKDGAPSQISALAQTEDGYLWIGSARGLFRFDGVEFESYVPPAGVSLPTHNITSLLATPDGGLWIALRPFGLGFLKGGQLKIFSRPEELPKGEVFELASDMDGRIWAATSTGLALLNRERWLEIGADWNLSNQEARAMFTDREGIFWVAIGDTIAFLPRGARSFQQTGIRTAGVRQITQAKAGQLWMMEWGKSVRPVPIAGQQIAEQGTEIQVKAYKLHFDRDGSLWLIGSVLEGLKRLRFPENLKSRKIGPDSTELESFSARDGLTDNTSSNILEDREGNIWISSSKGLDRFSRSHFLGVKLPTTYTNMTLLAGEGGAIWVGGGFRNPLLMINGGKVIEVTKPEEADSFYRDTSSIVWWGSSGGIWRQNKYCVEFFPLPMDFRNGVWETYAVEDQGDLWTGLADLGRVRFMNSLWTNRARPKNLPDSVPSAIFKDSPGRIWLGYKDGSVCLINGSEIQFFSRDDGIDIGRIKGIRGRGAQIWLGGETGLAIFNNGRFTSVKTIGEPFGSVSGIVETADGALWLNEAQGIVYISAAESRNLLSEPNYRISYRLYDLLDGMPGRPQINYTVSTAVEASDGRIWFATDYGPVWIDPAHQKINDLPPPVVVKSLSTDDKTYQPTETLELPKGTERLRISYTALSLSVPEHVRFKYRLEGFEDDWRDAVARREASFTNLGPGTYRFRVIASNNDGLWNEEGAILEFKILPMFYQTNWFLGLCVGALAFSVWLGHRLRVRQVKALIHLQFQERLAERTRVAREIHDTFLQTVQGSKMVADHALKDPADNARLMRAMKQLSTWLAQATEEGRAALNSLRASTTETNDLAEDFRRAIGESRRDSPLEISFSVKGNSREMHPLVRDEIYRIGYEAIRNACAHSHAERLEVTLGYAHDFTLRVSDNGVGIDPDVIERGKESHFGLCGMRERAERIGSKLTLVSSQGSGTVITLVVPDRPIFRSTRLDWSQRIKSFFRRN